MNAKKPIDYEKALNSEQRAAVLAPDGPLFVLAAAGTGKTRTLVYRVAHLVEKGIDPQRILLLTFTNRAAREMLERAHGLVGQGVSGLWGGTFHHMANRILRRQAHRLGYGLDFTILDQGDTKTLIRACLEALHLKAKEFPKADVLNALFSGAVNRRQSIRETIEARYAGLATAESAKTGHPVDVEDVIRVHQAYEKKKHEQNAMDFDDLLINGLALFQEHSDVLASYQAQFQYVLVDEYQDTNPIQADWVDLIAARHRNLLVVGDDFQSIYSWRGADYRNIMTFPKRYPDACHCRLVTNYRSVPEILEVANICIANNPRQFQKELRATRPSHQKPVMALLRDGGHQARYVIAQVRRLLREGYAWRDLVVLYRAHYHAMELQLALAAERIPYIVTSGVRFFEQAHIKDACALLRVLHNPGDEIAFTRLLELLPGVGSRTAARLWAGLGRRFDARDPVKRRELHNRLPAAARDLWSSLEPIMEAYATDHLNDDPAEVIFQFLKVFYDQVLLDTYEDYERRRDDLQEMRSFMSGFESTEAFLNEVALVTNVDTEPDMRADSAGDSLRLSTVHQAKGLEWKAVIILWAADGMFPSSRSLNETEGEDEERRLFYVAVTRAKDELILCVPEVRQKPDGGVHFLDPSRFLQELPPECVRQEQIGFL